MQIMDNKVEKAERDQNKSQIATYINCPVDCHIFDTRWLPTFPTKFVIVGATSNSQRGTIQICQLNNDQVDVEKIVEKKAAFRCASFDAITIRNEFCLGNFHGHLQIFDIERLDFPIYDVKAHDGVVNSLDGTGGANGATEIVTGGQDGCVKVWDPRQGVAVVSIAAVRKEDGGSGPRDCWSVTFADVDNQDDRVICAGFDNGDVKVIDLRALKERWGCNLGSGICKLSCDKKDTKTNRLLAGTVGGSVHLFDMSKSQIERNCADFVHKWLPEESSTIWSMNHLPQDDNIFSLCKGGSVEVWRYCDSSASTNEPLEMLTTINLSSAAINCFDWNPDFRGLGLCGSFDQKVRILVTSDV